MISDVDRLPKMAWWIRLSVWSAHYPRISAGWPPWPRPRPIDEDVQCMVFGCEQNYIVKSWRHPFARLVRPGCRHHGQEAAL